MKTQNSHFKFSTLALAIAGALVSMSSYAEDPTMAELKMPSNSVEVGVTNVDQSSARFGEYNGLNKAGAIGNAAFSIRGGDAYSKNEQGGTTRWSLTGVDLGTSSRSLSASFADQGSWNLGITYDELTHNLSDTYQTPSIGTMGGNVYTLPSSFTTAIPANANNLTAAQLASFREMDISSTRKNTNISGAVNTSSRWTLNYEYNHLDQTGAKLQAVPEMKIPAGAVNSTSAAPGSVANNVAGENPQILPMPTNYQTDTLNVGMNWVGDRGNFNFGYSGSVFHDGYDQLNFETFMGANVMQQMATMPSNQFHQLNAGGGYKLTDALKWTGNMSYSVNTQDSNFVIDPYMMTAATAANPLGGAPRSSMGGVVDNTHIDMKLSGQASDRLVLAGGVRYDERYNNSPANIYSFYAVDGSMHGLAVGQPTGYSNTPLSVRKVRYDLTGDYRIKSGQALSVDLSHEDINRWCANYGVNSVYVAGTDCVVADKSGEDKLDASYRIRPNEDLSLKFGYGYSNRNTSYDMNARAAFVGTNGAIAPGTAPAAATLVTMPGLNAGDFQGFHPFFEASRIENVLKANASWQATEKWGITASGRVTDDAYPTTYGVTAGSSWSADLDAAYAMSDTTSISGFVTQQHRQRNMTSVSKAAAGAATAAAIATPVWANWTGGLTDDDVTVGLTAKHSGMMDGKLDLAADVSYTVSNTVYKTALNYSTTTTGGLTCSAPTIDSCGQLPPIASEMTQFKLTGTYKADKRSTVVARYVYQQLNASDYTYAAMQTGVAGVTLATTPNNVLATNQQIGIYTVNLFSLAYVYTF